MRIGEACSQSGAQKCTLSEKSPGKRAMINPITSQVIPSKGISDEMCVAPLLHAKRSKPDPSSKKNENLFDGYNTGFPYKHSGERTIKSEA